MPHSDTGPGGVDYQKHQVLQRLLLFRPPANWTGPARLYLATGPRPPYCSAHYLLELELAEPSEAERWEQGELMVNLYGERGELTQHVLTPG